MTIVKKFDNEKTLTKKVVIFFIPVIVLVTVLEIWIVNSLSTFGFQISQMEKAKIVLTLQNQVLENKIAQKNSLKNVEKESEIMGFVHAKNIQYLQTAGLALNR